MSGEKPLVVSSPEQPIGVKYTRFIFNQKVIF